MCLLDFTQALSDEFKQLKQLDFCSQTQFRWNLWNITVITNKKPTLLAVFARPVVHFPIIHTVFSGESKKITSRIQIWWLLSYIWA